MTFRKKLMKKLTLYIAFLLAGSICEAEIPAIYIKCDNSEFEHIYRNYDKDIYIPVEVTFADKTWVNVEMRLRGDSSRRFPKKSLKFRFNGDPFVNGRDVINVNAEYDDPTNTRHYMAARLMRESGQPCFDANHVRVYLNEKYIGLYLMLDNIDADYLESRYLDPAGNLYKATLDGACLSYTEDIEGLWEKKTNRDEGFDDLHHLVDSLEYIPESRYEEFIDRHFHRDQLVNIISMNMFLANASTYYHNYHMYHDLRKDKWTMLPWDMDKTFSWFKKNFSYTISSKYWSPDNPLVERTILNQNLFNEIRNRLETLNKTILKPQRLHAIHDSLVNVIRPWIEKDTADKNETIEDWENFVNKDKEYIDERYNNLADQFINKPRTFRLNKVNKIFTDTVFLSWKKPEIQISGDVKYKAWYSTMADTGKGVTIYVQSENDTSVEITGIDEGDYFWGVLAYNDNYQTEAFDTYNQFSVKTGAVIDCEIEKDLTLTKAGSPY